MPGQPSHDRHTEQYVRNLENRVRELEGELAEARAPANEYCVSTSDGSRLYDGPNRNRAITVARNYHWQTRAWTRVVDQRDRVVWDSKMHGGVRRVRRPS